MTYLTDDVMAAKVRKKEKIQIFLAFLRLHPGLHTNHLRGHRARSFTPSILYLFCNPYMCMGRANPLPKSCPKGEKCRHGKSPPFSTPIPPPVPPSRPLVWSPAGPGPRPTKWSNDCCPTSVWLVTSWTVMTTLSPFPSAAIITTVVI